MISLLAATPPPAGGAPVGELAAVAAATSVATLLVLWLMAAYRRGGARPLRRLEAVAARRTGLPGWAVLPGLGAVLCGTVTIVGATWDIGLHIDIGRDEGPLGTAAHYPLLLGLFGTFLMGVVALGMAPRGGARPSAASVRLPGLGAVPAAAVLLACGAAFGMAAFPLDDVWHRVFGQDVTLWGPTHVMIIGGTAVAAIGGVLLLVEGAHAAGLEAFRGRSLWRRPLPALLAGVFLYLWAATLHEFHWGVPQFRLVWQPLLLAFGSAHALVLVRLLAGRGATLLALAVWLPLQVGMSLLIGGPLDVTQPAFPLFAAEALLIEALALRGDPRRPVAFGAAAGALVGTVGFGAEYLWSQVAMPLPWTAALLPEGLPVACAGGVAGGLLGALMFRALAGTLPRTPRAGALAGLAGAVFVALAVNAAIARAPQGTSATVRLTGAHAAPVAGDGRAVRVADLAVRFSDPELSRDPHWVAALGWQGGGRHLDRLRRGADGWWRTSRPVPVGGGWKTFVRVHTGRTMLAVPVRMPADSAIDFAGFPARPSATRAMVFDQELLQIERRADAPMALWLPATGLVLAFVLALFGLLGAVCARLGRAARPSPRSRPGPPRRRVRLRAHAPIAQLDRASPS